MDPNTVEAAITPRTRAILPVHMFGQVADMDPLVAIADRHGLVIVEDAAQAVGAEYHGRLAGQFGPAMFSLYATKNVMSGEGGMATTNDADLADRLRLYRNHGMRARYHHETLGTNFKPTDLAAAIGMAQLSSARDRDEQRRRNAERLRADLNDFHIPSEMPGRRHVWHQFSLRIPDSRDAVAEGLRKLGIGTLAYYPIPVHRQEYIVELLPETRALQLPITDQLASEVLSIPVRAALTDDELDQVVAAVRDVMANTGATVANERTATGGSRA